MDNELIKENLGEIYSSKIDTKNLHFFEGINFIKQVIASVNNEMDLILASGEWFKIKKEITNEITKVCKKIEHPKCFEEMEKIDLLIIKLMGDPDLLSSQIGIEKFLKEKEYEEDDESYEFYESQYNSPGKAKTWKRFNSLL